MGRGDGGFMTPKAIAKRIKAKGLQKLKWYCQPCEKQCRDENGFKCHCRTEGHQRQMLVFSENAGSIMSSYSKQFEKGFLDILARRHTTTKVAANVVYNEYIADKEHTRMNATMWTTLTAFVIYLGKTGKCKVEETERGWYIQYIDRDPRAMERQAARERAAKNELDDEQRLNRQIERQRIAALKVARERGFDLKDDAPVSHELKRDHDAGPLQPVALASSVQRLGGPLKKKRKLVVVNKSTKEPTDGMASLDKVGSTEQVLVKQDPTLSQKCFVSEAHGKISAKKEETDGIADIKTWLSPGIVVKVISKTFNQGVFKSCKGVVRAVGRDGKATLEIVSKSNKGEIVDGVQEKYVETVLPSFGKPVQFVMGKHRGENGVLCDLVQDRFCATVELVTGSGKGTIVPDIPYEHISKLLV